MPYEILNRYAVIDRLLRKKDTGTREEFASKLKVSVRTLYRYREGLEAFGAKIEYDSTNKSYFYAQEPQGLFIKEELEKRN